MISNKQAKSRAPNSAPGTSVAWPFPRQPLPHHYTRGGVECIDALASATAGLEGLDAVCTANAIKYLWRWKQKNGVEDLRKARWYIDKLITTNT